MKTLRLALLLNLLLVPAILSAHPMGNFSISHYSRLHVSSRSISVTTIFDFAEIATFQMFPDPRKATKHANDWVTHLHLQVGGRTLPLRLKDVRADLVPAVSGLPTLRVVLQTATDWNAGDVTLRFTDENYLNRIGWKEIVLDVDPDLSFPAGNPYANDRSHALTVFPEDLLSSPPAAVSASVRIAPAARKELSVPWYVNFCSLLSLHC